MHQQPNDRSCANEAIGGAHYGPVQVYMAKVSDATTAVGASSGWFKVFADTWANTGSSGADDAWGTKDLNTCCGKMNVRIPTDIAPVRIESSHSPSFFFIFSFKVFSLPLRS